jgi:hypothetical protein
MHVDRKITSVVLGMALGFSTQACSGEGQRVDSNLPAQAAGLPARMIPELTPIVIPTSTPSTEVARIEPKLNSLLSDCSEDKLAIRRVFLDFITRPIPLDTLSRDSRAYFGVQRFNRFDIDAARLTFNLQPHQATNEWQRHLMSPNAQGDVMLNWYKVNESDSRLYISGAFGPEKDLDIDNISPDEIQNIPGNKAWWRLRSPQQYNPLKQYFMNGQVYQDLVVIALDGQSAGILELDFPKCDANLDFRIRPPRVS